MSLIITASAVYEVSGNGDIFEPLPRTPYYKKEISRMSQKLKYVPTPEDIKREQEYQADQRRLYEFQ